MSLESLDQCPLCHEASFAEFLTCKDYTTTAEMFHVKQCSHCQFTVTSPRPTEKEAGKYYQSNDYISHSTTVQSFFDRIYLFVRHFTLKWKYELVSPYINNGALLDFGCGTGAFLTYCSNKGIKTSGIEPSEQARQHLTKLEVYPNWESLPEGKFDVITLWHVLEHIYPLHETIRFLKSRLSTTGTIFIAVPNRKSADAEHYQEYWAAYDVPRHIWHFSQENMRTLLDQAGLQLRETIPMKVDSYYVSLLSEKYKNHGSHSLSTITKAILNGYRSNDKARQTSNYSSLIYRITQ